MLLRRIRIGLDIEDEQMKEFGILQTPAAATPAPRTPGILAPIAPTVESEATGKVVQPESSALDDVLEVAQELEDLQSVKEEMLTVEDIEKEAVNVSLFPLAMVQQGLVEIESSSGSSSDSSSDDLSEDEERAPPKFSHPRYSEEVPADRDYYYRHNKSGILHSCETGKRVAVCKVAINANYKLMNRTMQIRYAKCIRCFPKNNNRVRSMDALATCCDSVLVCRGSNASLFCFISLGLVLLSVVTIPTGVLVGCMLIPVCTGSHSGVVPVYRFAEEGSFARLWFWKLLVPLKSCESLSLKFSVVETLEVIFHLN